MEKYHFLHPTALRKDVSAALTFASSRAYFREEKLGSSGPRLLMSNRHAICKVSKERIIVSHVDENEPFRLSLAVFPSESRELRTNCLFFIADV